jgi:alpha-L-rhamnosidase
MTMHALRLTLLFLLPVTYSVAQPACTPIDLQCEYLPNPLGIDAAHPRLSWKLEDIRTGAYQNAYQLIVGTDSVEVSKGTGNCWQTGQINAGTQLVSYQGKPLQPLTRYYYTVQIWDKDNKPSAFAATSHFETGMMNSAAWQGAWISDTRDIALKPAPYFRKTFAIDKKIKSARAYIAVGGLY